MNNQLLQYLFWILAALPVLALGLFLFAKMTATIIDRYNGEKKKKAEEAEQSKKRQTFEESYSRRRSGGI